MLNKTMERYGNAILRWIAAIAVGLIWLLNFFLTAEVAMDASERVTVHMDMWMGLAGVGMFLLLLAVAWWLKHKGYCSCIHERQMFFIGAGVYSVAALYLILNVSGDIRADAAWTFEAAAGYGGADGYAAVQPNGYIHMYPNQLGLMTFDRLLQCFSPHPKVVFVVNFMLVLLMNFLLVRIADTLFHRPAVNKATVLMAFAFLPPLFFTLFAYGLLGGLCAITAAFYYALRFDKAKQWRFLGLAMVCAAAAVLLKQNFLIAVVAMALYFLLRWLRDMTWRRGVAFAAAVLCTILPSRLLIAYYEWDSGASLRDGSPLVLWVAMGTDMDNTERAAGWYNGYNYATYVNSADVAEASQKGWEKLRENIAAMRENPARALAFFAEKTVTQWCEPMLQSAWSGPLADCGQEVSTALLRDFYTGATSYALVAHWVKLVTLQLWGLALVFIVRYAGQTPGWEMAFMHCIGGLLFHTVWEAKSQYIMPYVVLLIPFAAYAFCRVVDGISLRQRQ